MTDYLFPTFRPHEMTDDEMRLLAAKVHDPFNWYAPNSGYDEIFSLLRGRGSSYVDLVMTTTGDVPGFLVTELRMVGTRQVCYFVGSSFLPDIRGGGIASKLARRAITRKRYQYVAARTQNPLVYDALASLGAPGQCWPQHDGRCPPLDISKIAQSCSNHDSFDPFTLITRDAFGHVREDRSYMRSRNPKTQAMFEDRLGPNDGFMVVASLI